MGPDYGNPSYWDERYSADEQQCYDWYQDFSTLHQFIQPYLKDTADFEILVAGCGNSRLGADLYDCGFSNITNIDISTVVINQMGSLYANREEMEFSVMDVRNMEYVPEQCFDLVIDKALFDTLLCCENNMNDIQQYLNEMKRVIKSDGCFLIISHAPPDRRLSYFQQYSNIFEIESISIRKPDLENVVEHEAAQYHYLYIFHKIQQN